MHEAKSQPPEPIKRSEFPIIASHLLEYLFLHSVHLLRVCAGY